MERIMPLTAARANSHLECGEIIGHLNIILKENGRMQAVALPCTKPKLHRDGCAFEGKELIVMRRRL